MDRRFGIRVLALLVTACFVVLGPMALAKKKQTETAPEAAPPAPVADAAATVDGHTFTMGEVDALAAKNNAQLFQQLYTARRAALDQLVSDYLIEQEAKARGIDKDKLVAEEVTAKITPVTPDDVNAFYEQNKARMGGRTLDQMRAQIESYLQGQKSSEVRQAFLDRLKADHPVKIALDVPRTEVEIAANDPRKGPDTAPVRIVEFSDFQ